MSNVSAERNKGTNVSSSGQSYNAEQTAQTIKDIARRIREESAKMRETVRIIRQSGAIEELTEAVKEASIAARETSKEISDAAMELRERGVIRDTAVAVETTARIVKETGQSVSDISQQAKEAAPEISSGLSKGIEAAKEKVKQSRAKEEEA